MNGKKAKALRNLAIGKDEPTYTHTIFKKSMKTASGTGINYTVYSQKLKHNTARFDYKLLKKAYYAGELSI